MTRYSLALVRNVHWGWTLWLVKHWRIAPPRKGDRRYGRVTEHRMIWHGKTFIP